MQHKVAWPAMVNKRISKVKDTVVKLSDNLYDQVYRDMFILLWKMHIWIFFNEIDGFNDSLRVILERADVALLLVEVLCTVD